jgi:hypothetical protein
LYGSVFQRAGFFIQQAAAESMQGDSEVGVSVAINANRSANINLHTQLFTDFSPQGGR